MRRKWFSFAALIVLLGRLCERAKVTDPPEPHKGVVFALCGSFLRFQVVAWSLVASTWLCRHTGNNAACRDCDRFRQLAGQNPHLTDLRAYNSD